jgi:hypothetical protein
MKLRITIVAATLASALCARAAEPQSLSMAASGSIAVTTATFGKLTIFPSVNDTAVKGFQNESTVKPFPASQGQSVEGTGGYKLSGGVTVDLRLGAKIVANSVEVNATWDASGEADGTVRVDLNIPPDQAADMTVTVNGRQVGVNGKSSGGRISYPEEIIFTRTSTDKELYRITSSVLQGVVVGSENGFTIRLATMPGGKCLITDTKEAAWTLVFSE